MDGTLGRILLPVPALPRITMPLLESSVLGMPGSVYVDTTAYAIGANDMTFSPITVTSPIVITDMYANVTVATAASTVCRISIYEGKTGGRLLAVVGTFLTDSTGVKTVSGLAVALDPGQYLVSTHPNATPTITAVRRHFPFWPGMITSHSAAAGICWYQKTGQTYTNGPPGLLPAGLTAATLATYWYSPVSFKWTNT